MHQVQQPLDCISCLEELCNRVMIQCTYDTSSATVILTMLHVHYTPPPPPSYVTYETAVEFQITVHKSIHHSSSTVFLAVFEACNNKVQKCGITLRFIGYHGSSFDIRA